jgi:signal transduction histidine kinase
MEEVYHLNKVIEIQKKFIDGEIDREELDKQLKEENERYINILNAKNIDIQCNIDSDRVSQVIREHIRRNFRK